MSYDLHYFTHWGIGLKWRAVCLTDVAQGPKTGYPWGLRTLSNTFRISKNFPTRQNVVRTINCWATAIKKRKGIKQLSQFQKDASHKCTSLIEWTSTTYSGVHVARLVILMFSIFANMIVKLKNQIFGQGNVLAHGPYLHKYRTGNVHSFIIDTSANSSANSTGLTCHICNVVFYRSSIRRPCPRSWNLCMYCTCIHVEGARWKSSRTATVTGSEVFPALPYRSVPIIVVS